MNDFSQQGYLVVTNAVRPELLENIGSEIERIHRDFAELEAAG